MYRTNRSYVINVIGLWEFLEHIYDFLSMWLMVIGRNHKEIESNIQIDGTSLEQVSEFKYLGCTLTEDGKCTKELRIRLSMTHSALERLGRVWKSSGYFLPNEAKDAKSNRLLSALIRVQDLDVHGRSKEKAASIQVQVLQKIVKPGSIKGGLPFD